MVDWGGKKVSAQWLQSEIDAITRQMPHMRDPALRDAAGNLVKAMEARVKPAIDATGKVPKDFKQVPNSPRYGRMRGMWVRKEIHNDVVGGARFLASQGGIAEKILGHGGVLTKATQLWKLSKVAMNPPTQMRNFISNAVMLNLSGVPMHRIPQRMIQAGLEIARDGPHWKIAKEYGIGATTFSENELLRMEKEFIDLQARTNKNPIYMAKKIAAIIGNTAGDIYGASEGVFKLAKIIDAMEREGMSGEEAALEAQKWLFDYSLIPSSVQYLRNAPIGMPFICVDEATEILTQRGWLTLDTVQAGDIAASFDMEGESLKWKPIEHVHIQDCDDHLVYVQDRHLDMAMTPNHRCVSYRRRRSAGTVVKSLELVEAQNLKTMDHIPTAAPFDHKPVGEPVPDAWVELVGWYVTEGTNHPKCDQIILSQNEGPDADRIADALSRAGFTWNPREARFRGWQCQASVLPGPCRVRARPEGLGSRQAACS